MGDTVFLALRVIVSLGAVFGALWFAHRWITKGRPGRPGGRSISVVARQGLGAKAGVAIVQAGGRQYLLGVTEHAVTVLDRLDGDVPGGAEQVVRLVATGPVDRPGFGEALAVAVAATGTIPMVRVEPRRPELLPTAPVVLPVPVARRGTPTPAVVAVRSGEPHSTRRAARRAERMQPSPVAGSILSPETWRRTAAALRNLR